LKSITVFNEFPLPVKELGETFMNILFLLTDQWPHDSFGRYKKEISTPNMDKLAAEGTVFTNAFTTCPLCSPARGTLFTGRWTFQNGVKDNLNIGHSTQESLSKEEDTWLDAAMRRGYDTGYFGKWHLGHEKEPLKRLDLPVQKSAHRELSYNEVKANIKKIEREVLLEGNAPFWGVLPGTKEDTRAFKTVAGGVEFLERYAHSSKDTPFCLTVSTSSPHFPPLSASGICRQS
jgi:arylsulfatase A-like enzyme